MKRCRGLVLLMAVMSPAWAGSSGEVHIATHARAGDVLQVGIPLAGFGLTFFLLPEEAEVTAGWDSTRLTLDWNALNGSPRHDFALAFARTEIFTYGLKYTIDADRPNGGAQSFPSGHTAISFMGAEFIRKEYGWGWGIPAYGAAGYVGWTRVASRNHWAQDVLAGAAIGMLSNHDLSDIRTPFGDFSMSMSLMTSSPSGVLFDSLEPAPAFERPAFVPGLRFELRF